MQFNSTISRLVTFFLFMLSFSMLTSAAPAPAALAVAGPGELSNALVARGDVSSQCRDVLVTLDAQIDVHIDVLSKWLDTLAFPPPLI